MILVDLWAASAASLASAAIAMRAHMLRPHSPAWTVAPWPVWTGLSGLGLGLGMCAMTLWFGAHATPREAVIYSLLAATSVAMLWNLNRHGRQSEVRRQQIAEDVEAAMQASGPAATYPWEARAAGDPALEHDHG